MSIIKHSLFNLINNTDKIYISTIITTEILILLKLSEDLATAL